MQVKIFLKEKKGGNVLKKCYLGLKTTILMAKDPNGIQEKKKCYLETIAYHLESVKHSAFLKNKK